MDSLIAYIIGIVNSPFYSYIALVVVVGAVLFNLEGRLKALQKNQSRG